MRSLLITAVAVGFIAPSAAHAQQPQATQQQPGVVIVSQNKCSFTGLNEVNNWWRSTGGPVLDDLVRQGRLTGWGVLAHSWGDEWNHVVYYTARDLNTFTTAFAEFFRVASQRDPTIMQRLTSWCTEHKDNIYTVVLTNAPPR
jgi:hypothetical protein